MMRAVIIDDQEIFRKGCHQLLGHYCPDVAVIGEADGVSSGKELLQRTSPDLVFLDVEMQDGTGIDLIRQLQQRSFHLVFITAHDRYALDAIQLSAIDYLLKPLDPEDLVRAVGRARDAQEKDQLNEKLEALLENLNAMPLSQRKIVLREAGNLHIVPMSQILHCRAEGSYTSFYLENAQVITVSKHLKAYEKLLQRHGFFRPHNSHLVNLDYVVRFEKAEGGMLVMQDETRIPVSHRRKDQLLDLLASI